VFFGVILCACSDQLNVADEDNKEKGISQESLPEKDFNNTITAIQNIEKTIIRKANENRSIIFKVSDDEQRRNLSLKLKGET